LRTPDGEPIPPNTLAELKRNFERQALIKQQIQSIEKARVERLSVAPAEGEAPW
jgi:transposase